jgi:hypothetical protein
MLPAVMESDVEPSELERLALKSNRLLTKLVDAGDKKNEYVGCCIYLPYRALSRVDHLLF